MAGPRISLQTLTAAACALAMFGGHPASAEPKKVSKGSGQYEEHYELVPDDDPNAPPPANAGNLDPEGDRTPPRSRASAPGASHKGPFLGAASPAGTAKKQGSEPAPPVTAYPEPERAGEPSAPRGGKAAQSESAEGRETRESAGSARRATKAEKPEPDKAAQHETRETLAPDASQERKRSTNPASPEQEAAIADVAFFYTAVNDGGAWIDHSRYGRVFVPKVGEAWRPFTEGRWAYADDYGWVWLSDEPFGWAAYHYGRWALEADKGWFWIPGTEWSSAWVVWRQGEDAIGWAALPPSAAMTEKGLRLEASAIETSRFESTWVFVDPRYFGQPGMRRYLRSARWNADLVPTTVTQLGFERKADTFLNRGVAPEDVARLTGRSLPHVSVALADDARFKRQDTSRGGSEVTLYRPGARTLDRAAKTFAKVRRPEEDSGDGEPKSRKQKATSVNRFSPQPVLQRIETESGVTESWVTPSAQPQAAAKDLKPKPASKSEGEAKPSKHADEKVFTRAASERTETESAVTESWATPPSSAQRDKALPKTAKNAASATDADAKFEKSASKAKPEAGAGKSAAGDPLAQQHEHGSRYESYSAVPDGEPKKKNPSQAAAGEADTNTSTGSVSGAKRRWDGSGASGAPAAPPGLAQ